MPESEKKLQVSLFDGFYTKLLFLYPTAYRRKYAAQMQQVFRDLYQDAQRRKTRFGLFRLWVRVLIDLAASVIEEHYSEVFQMKTRKFTGVASVIATLGGLLTIIIIFSNWDESPYPFPLKDELPNQTFIQQSVPLLWERQLISITHEENAEIGLLPLPLYRIPEFTIEGIRIIPINDWQATAAAYILPLLWFGGLASLIIWVRKGKLEISGLSASVIGSLMMAASMFQASRSGGAEASWTLFSWGVFLLGGGLALFGLGALKNKTLPRWNALPLVMGLMLVALEAGNRLLPPDALQSWVKIQGAALLLFGLAWVVVGYILFANRLGELQPA